MMNSQYLLKNYKSVKQRKLVKSQNILKNEIKTLEYISYILKPCTLK